MLGAFEGAPLCDTSLDPATSLGTGFLPIIVTLDVGITNPFPGGGGLRSIQFALKLIF